MNQIVPNVLVTSVKDEGKTCPSNTRANISTMYYWAKKKKKKKNQTVNNIKFLNRDMG